LRTKKNEKRKKKRISKKIKDFHLNEMVRRERDAEIISHRTQWENVENKIINKILNFLTFLFIFVIK